MTDLTVALAAAMPAGLPAAEANNALAVILPGVVLAVAAALVFAVDLFVAAKAVLAWLAAAGLAAAAVVAAWQWTALGGEGRGPETGFAGMVALDRFALFSLILFAVIGVLTVMLADGYLARRNAARGEFYGLLLLVITGMYFMAASTDIIAFFVAFELMSLPTYILAGYLWREERSGEASLKYFVTGAFSSAILAFGLALLYAATGQTNYAAIAATLTSADDAAVGTLLVAAVVLVVTGFGFKVSAVPFHSWAPDVYEGAPTPVTAFMSTAVKAAAFIGFTRLFVTAAQPQWETWVNALVILAVLTMVIGNALALPQRNLKRMLAYSSVAHAGYLTLGLISAGSSGDPSGIATVLFYLVAYAVMNLGAFGVLIWIRNRQTFAYTLDEVAGLARRMPWLGVFTALFMVSLAGIPPTIGFWGKFYLFTSVVAADYTWLAIVAVIMSAVSAFYYLRVVWYMYFKEAPQGAAAAVPAAAAAAAPARTLTWPLPAFDTHVAPATAGAETAAAVPAAPAPAAAPSAAAPVGPSPTVAADDRRQLGVVLAVALTALGVLALGLYPQPVISAAERAVTLILGG